MAEPQTTPETPGTPIMLDDLLKMVGDHIGAVTGHGDKGKLAELSGVIVSEANTELAAELAAESAAESMSELSAQVATEIATGSPLQEAATPR
jgi:hypothetical protein